MENPLVSIIVPTYNIEKYARFCFDSLINQTIKNIEIILVDDGSTDSSGTICDEYAAKDARVRVIHQTNRGLGLSRNSGLELATGEYIGFVDSDDCVSKDMFRILYENAIKYVADISYCTYKKFACENEIVDEIIQFPEIKQWNGEKDIRQYMLNRIGLPPQDKKDNLYGASVCCGIFARKLLIKLDAKFVSERRLISEDMIFDIDVIPYCSKIVHCDVPLYYYRYNPNSLTTIYKQDRFEKNIQLYHEMYRRLKSIYNEDVIFNSMSRYLMTTARNSIIQEAKFIKQNGRKIACKNVVRICENQDVQTVLAEYKYKKLPLKYRLTCFLIKHKMRNCLLFLYRIHIIRDEKKADNRCYLN